MELRHLRYFIAVAEHENVTRAAAQLRVAQPSLSRQIRDLEDKLGFCLFEHGAKSLRLTEAGRVFLDHAREVERRTHEAVESARAVANGQIGELHLGYAPSLAAEILPRLLRAFQEQHPGVRMHLHDQSTQEMLRGLRNGTLHIALLVQVNPKVMADLSFEELECHTVCIAMHPAHPLAKVKKPGLEQLVNERLIAFTFADYPEHHAWIAGLFAPFARSPLIVEEHDSATSLIAAVEAGRGVALVSQRMDCMAGSRLKIVPVHPAPPPLIIGIATRKEKNAAAVANFLKVARKTERSDS